MATNAPKITYYLVMFPQAPDVGGSTRPISKLLKMEEEEVRNALLTKTFVVLSRFAKKANAEGLKNQLFALGISTIIVSDQDLRGHLFVSAASASRGAGGIAFRDFDEKPLYTPFEDIAGVTLMEIPCKDDSSAIVLDIYRKSTSITPRLDASLFDFATMMGNPGAGLENFLAEIENRCLVTIDRSYGKYRDSMIQNAKDFGSRPTAFNPPATALRSPYDTRSMIGANIWSFLLYTRTRAGA